MNFIFIQMINLNSSYDSFNFDDMESDDYDSYYEIYNHMEEYDQEDITPDFY